MVDAHCHVDLYPDPQSILKESDALGIYTIAVTNLPSHFKMGYSHVLPYKKTRLALGMHPLHAKHHLKEMGLFKECIDKTSYIGEIGLDFSKEGINTSTLQLNTFNEILNLLTTKNKLLSLHSRKAEKQVIDHLIKYEIKNAIFHWYTGTLSLVPKIAEAGYFFSVNPAMLNSISGQNVIKQIPLNRLLTESDGPFVQSQGTSVKPADMHALSKKIAELKELSQDEIDLSIKNNFTFLISSISK